MTAPVKLLKTNSGYDIVVEDKSTVSVCPFTTHVPEGYLPYDEFSSKVDLSNTSTEQRHPLTSDLSQLMQEDTVWGISQLASVDVGVVSGYSKFRSQTTEVEENIAVKLKSGGRVFLIGSGSSGRAAAILAAKLTKLFPDMKDQFIGLVAGGDSAFIRPKEKFEDSEADGAKALEGHYVTENDAVILISGSGTAKFNVGCGHYAANKGAGVVYFHNSEKVPDYTEQLFKRTNNPVYRLCTDIGAQGIAGSTRMQAATLALLCLGTLLQKSALLSKDQDEIAEKIAELMGQNAMQLNTVISSCFGEIAKFIEIASQVFSNEKSNFRRLKDETGCGYITLLAGPDSIMEAKSDGAEMSPTFSINPINKEDDPVGKMAEYRTYLVGPDDNRQAWEKLFGRYIMPSDVADTDQMILGANVEGVHSFAKRPKGEGNFVIGVAKLQNKEEPISEDLSRRLAEVKEAGGKTGLILVVTDKVDEKRKQQLHAVYDACLIVDELPNDDMGLTQTIALKQVLNHISNGTMVKMHKVHGNRMIDMRSSNNKLISRAMLNIKVFLEEERPDIKVDDRTLYHYVTHSWQMKKDAEKNGRYTPSIIKMVLTMLINGKTPEHFDEVAQMLLTTNEKVNFNRPS